jgi:hypothetical protein
MQEGPEIFGPFRDGGAEQFQANYGRITITL